MSKKLTLKENRRYMRKIADFIIAYVKRFDIHVLRYDSITTESIYLKFDYGMSGSLRISSHSGKDGLSYTFNILKGLNEPYKESCKSSKGTDISRYYYPDCLYKNVALDIIRYREYKINKYGEKAYYRYLKSKRVYVGKGNMFWGKCKEV